ncbi:PREDICTED: metabotropic glutamate receptor 2-like [Priapulus caudatus]|uniref:Metabotropic glutamate receptor 2-like n=1 Tax=Priapulus caudatus TaxID=37621 RepID=A0ABM1ECB8_PRICU|nr:PREDICTED: metabotropic glutamate receptor 2-like [Priapulus caudatus]
MPSLRNTVFIVAIVVVSQIFLCSCSVIIPGLQSTCVSAHENLMLGGIFPVHGYGAGHRDDNECGALNPYSIEFALAMIYTIERLNADERILPNISLGYVIFDSCGKDTIGMSQALQFVTVTREHHRAAIEKWRDIAAAQIDSTRAGNPRNKSETNGRSNPRQMLFAAGKPRDRGEVRATRQVHIDESGQLSPTVDATGIDDDIATDEHKKCSTKDVVGVIGPIYSETSELVAPILGVLQIPQVSPSSGSDDLSITRELPYFLRTAPPDINQVHAILALVQRYGWSYVAVLATVDGNGEHLAHILEVEAKKMSICFSVRLWLAMDVGGENLHRFSAQLHAQDANVIISFIRPDKLYAVRLDLERMGTPTDRFVWLYIIESATHYIGSLERVSDGAIFLRTWSPVDQSDFSNWLSSMTLGNYGHIRWFRQYWEKTQNCSFVEGTCTEDETVVISHQKRLLEITDITYNIRVARRGPRHEFCGTPHLQSKLSDKVPRIDTRCDLCDK